MARLQTVFGGCMIYLLFDPITYRLNCSGACCLQNRSIRHTGYRRSLDQPVDADPDCRRENNNLGTACKMM